MSSFLPRKNVRFWRWVGEVEVKVVVMFRGSRAPWSRSEDRCDGAGSEADGAKPPVKTGSIVARSGGFGFSEPICFGEAFEQRFSDIQSATTAGLLLPGDPFPPPLFELLTSASAID